MKWKKFGFSGIFRFFLEFEKILNIQNRQRGNLRQSITNAYIVGALVKDPVPILLDVHRLAIVEMQDRLDFSR